MKPYSSTPLKAGEPVEFEIDGDKYTFTPPKKATSTVALLQAHGDGTEANMSRVGAMFSWLGHGLNRGHETKYGKAAQPGHATYVEGCQACFLQARLEDPDDDLDISKVMDVINDLLSEVSGRPTT